MTTLTADGVAIHAAILREPGCDLHRLAFADYLDEQGDHNRAEFIRVQCEIAWLESAAGGEHPNMLNHPNALYRQGQCFQCDKTTALGVRERDLWGVVDRAIIPVGFAGHYGFTPDAPNIQVAIFRRGFVDEVRLSCAAFVGERCAMCDGAGSRTVPGGHGDTDTVLCAACNPDDYDRMCGRRHPDAGRTPGLARAIFAAHPVTRVVLVDTTPGHDANVYTWERDRHNGDRSPATLPPDLWEYVQATRRHTNLMAGRVFLYYQTAAAANDALSAGGVALGRSRAGLPPLAEGNAP